MVTDFLYLFFEPTETSQVRGKEYLKRLRIRQNDRSPLVKEESFKAQTQALLKLGGEDSLYERLGEIKQPVLVMNGDNDIMAPTVNSFIMSQRIENAQLILYPDSGHGFLFRYP
ncbi:alpha/beta fold hydrolase [Neobacillus sp. NRS-1170]|uniref:alpha/beta fold hydrolase n=1 Tax=Neobacillus sp. NRS-1170 TaxID=3233898 RepID=UPI003D2C9E17